MTREEEWAPADIKGRPIQDQTINGCLSNLIPLHNWALLYLTSYCVDFELSFNPEGSGLFLCFHFISELGILPQKVIGLEKVKSK